MRRFVTIVLVLLVVGGGSWFAYQQFAGPWAAAAPDYEIVPVSRGTVTANVSATGSVLPEREARLVFEGTGMITAVEIESGDQVKAGQLLAQLDTSDIELAVRQAEIGLRTAKAQLQQLDEGASESDLAAAEAGAGQRPGRLPTGAQGFGRRSVGGRTCPGRTGARDARTGAAGVRQGQGPAERGDAAAVAAAPAGDHQL